MEQLPRANVVLLRYLFGVLHSIEKQSEDNQMTAFNLAVCIAPSLLWPPAPASPGTEGEFTKKVSSAIVRPPFAIWKWRDVLEQNRTPSLTDPCTLSMNLSCFLMQERWESLLSTWCRASRRGQAQSIGFSFPSHMHMLCNQISYQIVQRQICH